MSKRFKGCHIEGVHSPTKAWDYPGDTEKSGSVVEAAIEYGDPPKPMLNQAGAKHQHFQ